MTTSTLVTESGLLKGLYDPNFELQPMVVIIIFMFPGTAGMISGKCSHCEIKPLIMGLPKTPPQDPRRPQETIQI